MNVLTRLLWSYDKPRFTALPLETSAQNLLDCRSADSVVGIRQGKSPFGHTPILGGLPALLGFMRYKLSDPEPIHKQIEALVDNQQSRKTFYCRLNVDWGLHDMPLDEWETTRQQKGSPNGDARHRSRANPIADASATPTYFSGTATVSEENIIHKTTTVQTIEDKTQRYLARESRSNSYPPIAPQVRECAEKLVLQAQKRRHADPPRWEYFIGNSDTLRVAGEPRNFQASSTTAPTTSPTVDGVSG